MNSYVVSGPRVQLSAVFRVSHTAGGANFDLSSHLMAWAQTSGPETSSKHCGVGADSARCQVLPALGVQALGDWLERVRRS